MVLMSNLILLYPVVILIIFDENGKMATGWHTIKSTTYHFNKKGIHADRLAEEWLG